MKLTNAESSFMLDELLKSKGSNTSQLEKNLKSTQPAMRRWCRNLAIEMKVLTELREQQKIILRNNKSYSALRKDLVKALPRRTSKAQFLANAKAKTIEGELAPLFMDGKRLNTAEALIVYTASTKHTGKALSKWEIERTFATQEGDLVGLARRYCKSIGLMVA